MKKTNLIPDTGAINAAAKEVIEADSRKLRLKNVLLMLVPTFVLIVAIILHLALPDTYTIGEKPGIYIIFLYICLGLSIFATVVSLFWYGHRKKYQYVAPVLGLLFLAIEVLDILTLKTGIWKQPLIHSPDRILYFLQFNFETLIKYSGLSLKLLLLGFLSGAVSGFISGVLCGWSKLCDYWISPLLKIIGPVPSFVWLPVVSHMIGSAFTTDLFLIGLSVWFPLTLMLSSRLKGIEKVYIERAEVLNASPIHILLHIALPYSLPAVFDGLFMGLASAFSTLSIVEMLGVSNGLAIWMNTLSKFGRFAEVYGDLMFIIVIFFGLTLILLTIRKKVLKWQTSAIRKELR